MTRSLRVALFTHDTFGLGHVRRSVRIMRAVAQAEPGAAQLLVTGSAALHALAELPAHADYVKVPTTVKTGARGNLPSHLPIPPAERVRLRADLIREAVLGFAPDVFLVDNFPLGSQGELLPTLKALRATPTRTLLGLRDVLDAPEAVRADWEAQGVYQALARYFDRILVYGMPQIMDVVAAYALPPATAAKVRYCGYVTDVDPALRPAAEMRASVPLDRPFLVATGGGGGDAYPLLDLFLDAVDLLPQTSSVVVAGPLMGADDRARLRARTRGREEVSLLDHTSDLSSYMAAADAVVSMCGYNTAAEIAGLGARAVVVPRTWRYGEHQRRGRTGVEWEQLLRARALAEMGCARLLEPDAATPARLAAEIGELLATRGAPGESAPRNGRSPLDVGGLEAATTEILGLAGREVGVR